MPFISDVYQHEFDGLEHISLVHAKYGNEHLQKEVAENSAGNEANKSQNITKFQDPISFHICQQAVRYDFLSGKNDIPFFDHYPGKLLFVPLSTQGPPPKFS